MRRTSKSDIGLSGGYQKDVLNIRPRHLSDIRRTALCYVGRWILVDLVDDCVVIVVLSDVLVNVVDAVVDVIVGNFSASVDFVVDFDVVVDLGVEVGISGPKRLNEVLFYHWPLIFLCDRMFPRWNFYLSIRAG
ncbi:hypothetical protein OUZ56_026266 [Daphnia magna]|uniref:Uncharacterized protein n=1 Tax=Daphnia magna TaxID=35525 RepID=A0ABQ9ZL84_9CRUS|nr:hypothetical protein OUZ56_026266 [Daphnia magna]